MAERPSAANKEEDAAREDQEDGDNESQESQVYLDKAQEYCLEAHCLLNGHGIGQQIDDALHWYRKSIDKGEPKAMLALGVMNEKGVGMRTDAKQAQEYYQRAADKGEPLS